jgi:superfamily I DNA/RNA helicase
VADQLQKELDEALDRILRSKSRKKLIVAGPGSGKTFLFKKLLETTGGGPDDRLVLTFINNLKSDLERGLGDQARVNTLHGYCQSLLHKYSLLRNGLSADFVCFPGLVSLIKTEWAWKHGSHPPKFVELMRDLKCPDDESSFYFDRADYYDAVDFDDSVYRTLKALEANPGTLPKYDLVLIDEFQDFNEMEAVLIDTLGEQNPIAIAGDDDQALYAQLRGASWDHIRKRHSDGEYEKFELPFCMRCPEVIVEAINDVLVTAKKLKKLAGRIEKPYRFYPPKKGEDSKRFPQIDHVNTTVQRDNANYFGKYAEYVFSQISQSELDEAKKAHEPALLIIGSNPYRRQVEEYLTTVGLVQAANTKEVSDRDRALLMLKTQPHSNLAWRIILDGESVAFAKPIVLKAIETGDRIIDLLPKEFRDGIIDEAMKYEAQQDGEKDPEPETPPIKTTSFEGSKGLSAQYVMLIGVHKGELPHDSNDPTDIEICRFLVGLTRTKSKCSILTTSRFASGFKEPSPFLGWVRSSRLHAVKVDAHFWVDA